MKNGEWRDSLSLLCEMGWDPEEIEGACDALNNICADEEFDGDDAVDLTDAEIEATLGDELTDEERDAFRTLALVQSGEDGEAAELRSALWDSDSSEDE